MRFWVCLVTFSVLTVLSGCGGVSECAGGTVVEVVNETTEVLTVEVLSGFIDAGAGSQSVAPGAILRLVDDLYIGGSALPVTNWITSVRVSAGETGYYDGPVEAPAFAVETDSGDGCSYASYTLTVSP